MEFQPEIAAYRYPGIGPDGKNHGFYASGSGFSSYFRILHTKTVP